MEGRSHPGAASYSLTLSEQELVRYRIMAAGAADNEAAEWLVAGVVPGARVADVDAAPAPCCGYWRNGSVPRDRRSASTLIPER